MKKSMDFFCHLVGSLQGFWKRLTCSIYFLGTIRVSLGCSSAAASRSDLKLGMPYSQLPIEAYVQGRASTGAYEIGVEGAFALGSGYSIQAQSAWSNSVGPILALGLGSRWVKKGQYIWGLSGSLNLSWKEQSLTGYAVSYDYLMRYMKVSVVKTLPTAKCYLPNLSQIDLNRIKFEIAPNFFWQLRSSHFLFKETVWILDVESLSLRDMACNRLLFGGQLLCSKHWGVRINLELYADLIPKANIPKIWNLLNFRVTFRKHPPAIYALNSRSAIEHLRVSPFLKSSKINFSTHRPATPSNKRVTSLSTQRPATSSNKRVTPLSTRRNLSVQLAKIEAALSRISSVEEEKPRESLLKTVTRCITMSRFVKGAMGGCLHNNEESVAMAELQHKLGSICDRLQQILETLSMQQASPTVPDSYPSTPQIDATALLDFDRLLDAKLSQLVRKQALVYQAAGLREPSVIPKQATGLQNSYSLALCYVNVILQSFLNNEDLMEYLACFSTCADGEADADQAHSVQATLTRLLLEATQQEGQVIPHTHWKALQDLLKAKYPPRQQHCAMSYWRELMEASKDLAAYFSIDYRMKCNCPDGQAQLRVQKWPCVLWLQTEASLSQTFQEQLIGLLVEQSRSALQECKACQKIDQLVSWQAPRALTIQIGAMGNRGDQPLRMQGEIPLELRIDLGVPNDSVGYYSLQTAIFHSGSLCQGHYYGYVLKNGQWYLCNDAYIQVTPEAIVKRELSSAKGGRHQQVAQLTYEWIQER